MRQKAEQPPTSGRFWLDVLMTLIRIFPLQRERVWQSRQEGFCDPIVLPLVDFDADGANG